MAFRIQDTFNELTSRIDNEEEARLLTDLTEDEKIRYEDARLEKEAIIGELLQLAVNLDYSDEIGRRKMFQLVRKWSCIVRGVPFSHQRVPGDMLSQELLPQSLLNKCLDVLRKLSPNERDLIRVLVELVQDLRDRTCGDGEEEDPSVWPTNLCHVVLSHPCDNRKMRIRRPTLARLQARFGLVPIHLESRRRKRRPVPMLLTSNACCFALEC